MVKATTIANWRLGFTAIIRTPRIKGSLLKLPYYVRPATVMSKTPILRREVFPASMGSKKAAVTGRLDFVALWPPPLERRSTQI
jgi:hypothetical protein